VTALPTDTISECAKRMHAEHVGCLVVVEKTDGIGVPDRDADRPRHRHRGRRFGLDPNALTAGDVMSEKPAVVEEDDDVLDVLARMRERGARRLPVTGLEGGSPASSRSTTCSKRCRAARWRDRRAEGPADA